MLEYQHSFILIIQSRLKKNIHYNIIAVTLDFTIMQMYMYFIQLFITQSLLSKTSESPNGSHVHIRTDDKPLQAPQVSSQPGWSVQSPLILGTQETA